MSDELNNEIKSAIDSLQEPQEAPAVQEETPEDVARSQGWRPKEEYDGDKAKWVPADEFLRRKPLFDKIHEQSKLLKNYEKAIIDTQETVKKIEERTRREEQEKFQRQLDEIKAQRRAAIREGDEETVDRLDEQLKRVEQLKPVDPVKQEPQEEQQAPKEILDWVGRNKWYETDEDLHVFMNIKQAQNLKKGMSVAEALQASEKQVRQAFAHKFENPNKDKASPVIPRNPEPKKAGIDDLPASMRKTFHIVSRITGITLEEYVAEQKRAGNL